MSRKQLFFAAFALIAGAAVLFALSSWRGAPRRPARRGFAAADSARLVIDRKPFRFVGANIDLMFQQNTRSQMSEMMHTRPAPGFQWSGSGLRAKAAGRRSAGQQLAAGSLVSSQTQRMERG